MRPALRVIPCVVAAFAVTAFSPLAHAASGLDPLSWQKLLQVALGLTLVLGVFALLIPVIRRLGGAQRSASAAMQIIDGLSLGNRERLVLLEVQGQRILLAQGAGSIQTLHVFAGNAQPSDSEDDTQPHPLLEALSRG